MDCLTIHAIAITPGSVVCVGGDVVSYHAGFVVSSHNFDLLKFFVTVIFKLLKRLLAAGYFHWNPPPFLYIEPVRLTT